jgi:DNA-binding IclR family transcriptional regulator
MTNEQPTAGLLARTTIILEAVVEAGKPVGPRSLARSTGIDRSAVGRILKQLAALDVLAAADGEYGPGPRLFTLGRVLSALDTLPAAATSVLADLVAEFDETSYVCTWTGESALFLYEWQSSKPLRFVVELGRPIPLHAGAAGRAIIAGLNEDVVRDVFRSQELPALTAATVVEVDELIRIRTIDRERGYSVSEGERVEGGVAIGTPFFDRNGACQGSVVLTAPLSRATNYDLNEVGQAVGIAARTLSARLGAPA